jgi:hypothetical protein
MESDEKARLSKALKDLAGAFHNLFPGISIHENIVKERYTSIIRKARKSIVHIPLKPGWSISYTKGYNIILKESISSLERGQMFIVLSYSNLIKCFGKIQLYKPSCIPHLI